MDPLNDLVKGTNFPWLMSNVIDKETNRPLAEGNISKVIEWEGCRIGLVSNEKLVQIREYGNAIYYVRTYMQPGFCFIR